MLRNLQQNQMGQNLNQIKNMMNTVRSMNNPSVALNNIMSQNPMMRQAMDYVNNNGGDPKTAFYKLANEMGVNPNDILNSLK